MFRHIIIDCEHFARLRMEARTFSFASTAPDSQITHIMMMHNKWKNLMFSSNVRRSFHLQSMRLEKAKGI